MRKHRYRLGHGSAFDTVHHRSNLERMRATLDSEHIGTHIATVATDQLIVNLIAVAVDIVAGRPRYRSPFRISGFQPAFGLVHRHLGISPGKTKQHHTESHLGDISRNHFHTSILRTPNKCSQIISQNIYSNFLKNNSKICIYFIFLKILHQIMFSKFIKTHKFPF